MCCRVGVQGKDELRVNELCVVVCGVQGKDELRVNELCVVVWEYKGKMN